jgi:hypothetical protein
MACSKRCVTGGPTLGLPPVAADVAAFISAVYPGSWAITLHVEPLCERDVVTMTKTIKRSLLAAIKCRRDRAAARTGVSAVCTKTVRYHGCSGISIGLHEECVESLNFAHCCLLIPLQTMGSLRAAGKIAWVVRHAFCAIWTPYWSFILLRFLRLGRCDCRCCGSTRKRRCPRSLQHIRELGLRIREQRIDGLEVDSGLRSVISGIELTTTGKAWTVSKNASKYSYGCLP